MIRSYGIDNPDDEGADYEYIIKTLQNIRRSITQQYHRRVNTGTMEDNEVGALIYFYNRLYTDEARWRYLADFPLIGARPKWLTRNEDKQRSIEQEFNRTVYRQTAVETT